MSNNIPPNKKKPMPGKKPEPPKNGKNLFVWLLIIVGLFYIFQWVFSTMEPTSQEMMSVSKQSSSP